MLSSQTSWSESTNQAYVGPTLTRVRETNRSVSNARRMTKPPKKKPSLTNGFEGPKQAPNPFERSASRGSTSSSTGLLSNVPYSHPTASNVFGIGSEHPFANYWTCQGGLPETISVLPEKLQADILLERYFECVDPVYPMIHRQTFYADYEHFWSLPQDEKNRVDGALVALTFSMLAMGTQFVTTTSPRERQQTAEFYVSAAHQSLRMSSYLNKASVRSIQAMVLITYFLINDNHASDGWAFAGILIRQAYAMGLHRDPNIVCPNASIFEKQVRRKLWQAVLLQDTFLTVLLSLPAFCNPHGRQRRRPDRRFIFNRKHQPHGHGLYPRLLDTCEPRTRNHLLASLTRPAPYVLLPARSLNSSLISALYIVLFQTYFVLGMQIPSASFAQRTSVSFVRHCS
jgi:hypothetical protein